MFVIPALSQAVFGLIKFKNNFLYLNVYIVFAFL
jgi:hypothetical protein